ncbi:selenocysteine insertion sequence-binding protein 2 isoform X3 [Cavia porcellus]|uniref:selenocysteine insertion sequence-binding protein 2 isoform X3 n=1 Tax=Cavia porcellus TaxID=10141 RepID=UPI002FE3C89F
MTGFLAPVPKAETQVVRWPSGGPSRARAPSAFLPAMASGGPWGPEGTGSVKLSADVKPFVPKFAGLNVAWTESSEACVFPSCAATYYPFVQESPLTEPKMYTEDTTFRAPAFPPQYLSSEITLHPYAYSPYTFETTQNVCSVPASRYDYSQPSRHRGFQTLKPPNEQMCTVLQETRAPLKKKTCDEKKTYNEQKFKRTDGPVLSEIKSARGSHHLSIHAENRSKPDGYHKRTDRKSRTTEKSPSTSKPEFEFSRLDFPELQGPESSVSGIQKQCQWGPLRSSATMSLVGEVGEPVGVVSGDEIVVKKTPSESVSDNDASNSPSCTRELSWTPMGYIVRQTLSSEPSPAPMNMNVTSMINLKAVSSADPKSVSVSSSEVLSSDPSYNKEKHGVHPAKKFQASQGGDPEQHEVSRKNKKKKEKSKSNYEILTVQQPPRIEDAEEFPNLAVASERRDRVESPKFPSKQQPQNNFRNSGKKSQIPVQLDLGGMLAALEKKQHARQAKQSSRPAVFSVGAVPVLCKDTSLGERGRRFSQVKTPHNPLDSSAPLIKKGKQREVPKAKKPTSLKKIILKEREERKQQRLRENTVSPAVAGDEVQDAESGTEEQAADPEQAAEEPASSTHAVEEQSEELPGPELQKDPKACQPAPEQASFPKIHSRRFRDYCSQMLSKEVDACVTDLLKELVRFQDRMYQKDPVKAKTKRRLVLGLREVLKHLKLRKLKCIIISPNCEKIQSKGGLDDTLHTIIDYACAQNIPFVFALNRKALGRSLNKTVPVSVVGIFSYDGAQDQFHKMVELTMAARQAYKTMLENVRQELAGEPRPQMPPDPPSEGPSSSLEDTAPDPSAEEPHYIQVWRKHLEAYSRCSLELEESLEASALQMSTLNL